jgi:hypothetical protein
MAKKPTIDELKSLRSYCKNEHQLTIIEAVIAAEGSGSKAAETLQMGKSSVNDILGRVRKYAADKGWAPTHDMIFTVPDSHNVKRVSSLRNREGEITAQWIISEPEKMSLEEQIRSLIAVFKEDLPVRALSVEPTGIFDTDLIPWLNIGDAHLGMLTAAAETNEDFDLAIGESEICAAFGTLLDRLPTTERIVLCDLGDMTHTEVNSSQTEASGHALDVDGRFYKIFKTYIRVMRFLIETALTKFKYVDVIINQGNHSRTNDIAMAEFLRHIYEGEERLHTLDNTNVFIPYRLGNTFVLTHHGDKTKMDRMTNVMVSDYRNEMDARYKYIYTGHIHNNKVLAESHGIVVESFNQMSAGDKYAFDAGYRSRKCMTAVLLSKTYGEKGRISVPIDEIKDIVGKLPAGDSSKRCPTVFTV